MPTVGPCRKAKRRRAAHENGTPAHDKNGTPALYVLHSLATSSQLVLFLTGGKEGRVWLLLQPKGAPPPQAF